MQYSELNTDLKSSYTKNKNSIVTITDDSLIPNMGLKARDILDRSEFKKLSRVREKNAKLLKHKDTFIKD